MTQVVLASAVVFLWLKPGCEQGVPYRLAPTVVCENLFGLTQGSNETTTTVSWKTILEDTVHRASPAWKGDSQLYDACTLLSSCSTLFEARHEGHSPLI